MARAFPHTSRLKEGGWRTCIIIKCGKCGGEHELSAHWKVAKGGDTNDAISTHMRKGGWVIGPSPEGDRCPDCAGALRVRRKPKNTSDLMATVFADPEPKIMTAQKTDAAKVPVAAEPPPKPDRESRRLIHAEIETNWLDERKGYAGGESDATIARRLGVPPAWVAEVREFSFGSVGANEDIAALEREHKTLLAQADAIALRQNALVKDTADLKDAVAALSKRAAVILKAVSP